jgi:dihydrofolate reductase
VTPAAIIARALSNGTSRPSEQRDSFPVAGRLKIPGAFVEKEAAFHLLDPQSATPVKKLILKMSVSADGFVGGPKGEIDWIFATFSPDAAKWTIDTLWDAGLHLMGSRTYHDMAAWWPTSTEEFAPPMNEIPKAVFSRRGLEGPSKALTTTAIKNARTANGSKQGATPSARGWESWLKPKVCTGNLATEIKRLKRGSGKPLLAHGGASFARSLVATGLVDEFRLIVHPVMLGQGLPIFSELSTPLYLELVESIPFKSGTMAQVYRAKRK